MKTESRILPHSIEIEQQVLSGCLQSRKILDEITDHLVPADFYYSKHQIIYKAIKDICSQNGNVDLVTVTEKLLKEQNIVTAVDLASLTTNVPLSINTDYDVGKIKEYSEKRKLIISMSEIQDLCYSNKKPVGEIIDMFQASLLSVGRVGTGGLKHVKESLDMVMCDVENLKRGIDVNTGLSTGFRYLDKCLGKMQRSDLIILAARPSMGKTTLAMNIAANVARDENISVDVFSIEMSSKKIATRLLCSEARVNSMCFKNNLLTKDDFEMLDSAAGIVDTYPIYIDDSPVLSTTDLVRRARKSKKEHNTGLIVIDYLQFMRGSGDFVRKDLEIGSITRAAKQVAKELDIPVIMLSQLNRSLENRENKKPRMSDLRESGAIEQDADVIMFIYRDEVYNKDRSDNKGLAEIIIAKNRDGIIADIPLRFIASHTRFEDIKQ